MKKLLVLFMCFVGQNVSSYISVTGPLQLGDEVFICSDIFQMPVIYRRGEIIKTLQETMSLHSCLQALCKFTDVNTVQELPSYQNIMEKLSSLKIVTPESEAAIEAIEYAIMYAYDKQVYILGGYTKYASIFFSGLRWRALNPFSYANPFSWVVENHEKASQLLCEFEQLVDIAYKTKSSHYYRLYATLISYKHWRKVRILPLLIAGAIMFDKITARPTYNSYGAF